MKSHATPGPWHVSDPELCNEVIDSMGRTIAEVEEWDSTGRGNVPCLRPLMIFSMLWNRYTALFWRTVAS